jgi:hypothetical protein
MRKIEDEAKSGALECAWVCGNLTCLFRGRCLGFLDQ